MEQVVSAGETPLVDVEAACRQIDSSMRGFIDCFSARHGGSSLSPTSRVPEDCPQSHLSTGGSSAASEAASEETNPHSVTRSKSTCDTEAESESFGLQEETNRLSAGLFAPRRGRALHWNNVNMALVTNDRKLLDNVSGHVPANQVTAIVGASGAGKTSLLNILSGRLRSSRRLRIASDVRLDDLPVDPTDIRVRKSIAFVEQTDSLQATATPREAIRFSARLRLSRETLDHEIDQLVDTLLGDLGLFSCADTVIGGPLLKGVSSGERKRTSVGCELVCQPSLIFLDEYSSGLDSFSAYQLCQVLKKVANAGASVLCTIHQPNSIVFNSFDHLIMLHKGRVLYQGPVSSISKYFASKGFPCPSEHNPADWVVHVAQSHAVGELERSGFFSENGISLSSSSDATSLGDNGAWPSLDEVPRPPGFQTQFRLLLKRELQYIYRFPYPQYARFGLTTFISIMIGTIFYGVGEISATDSFILQSQFGAMMILLMFAMLGTAQSTLLFFPEERPIFLREYSTGYYSVSSYFMSRLFIEAVNNGIQILILVSVIHSMVGFQGSFFLYFATTYTLAMSGAAIAVLLGVLSKGNGKVAQEMLPVVFFPQLLFSGYFVSIELVPTWLQWVQNACVLTYAVRVLVTEEFLDCSDDEAVKLRCNLLVDNLEADPERTWFYWIVLVEFFVVFRVVALFLLQASAY